MTSNPYSTGGGGVVFEHRYGALLLSRLLTGEPVPGLGDAVEPEEIQFQASSVSAVDDLFVVGRAPNGEERKLSIGVRRDPAFVRSEASSVSLLAQYVEVVSKHWGQIQQGRWRLGLTVSNRNTAVTQVDDLAEIARATNSNDNFREEIERDGRTNASVRRRLEHLDGLVNKAVGEVGVDISAEPEELVWGLLSALYVFEPRIEGSDTSDRAEAISRLREVTSDRTNEQADALFNGLVKLVSDFAPRGEKVTERSLRGDLFGFPLGRSPRYTEAWEVLKALDVRVRKRTRFELEVPGQDDSILLNRSDELQDLVGTIKALPADGGALVVEGEPDVGKSSLTLRAAEEIGADGGTVTCLSLRDLPPTVVEFENILNGTLQNVFAGMPTAPERLLVIDGGEAVLEKSSRKRQLREFATAASDAGLKVVIVTRNAGTAAVAEVVAEAVSAASDDGRPNKYTVRPLEDDEVERIAEVFPRLSRLRGDQRREWILRRLGLIDLLLRSGTARELPEGPLCEADVLTVVWRQLVRNGEVQTDDGITPDQRDRAMSSLAYKDLLGMDSVGDEHVEALQSLRSDGLLMSETCSYALRPSDDFASDLIRDFAVAQLLTKDGVGLLKEGQAPRWAIRASRIACQHVILSAKDPEHERVSLQSEFDELASEYGARWEEVPFEAILTVRSAQEVLRRAWSDVTSGDADELNILFRTAKQRFSKEGIGDRVLEPLVSLIFCSDDSYLEETLSRQRGIGEKIREVALAWLRGLTMEEGIEPLITRQEVRDCILNYDPEPWNEFAVEALALLGPDLDDGAEAFLRQVADENPSQLHAAVESVWVARSMVLHKPELLLALTEAYYVDDTSARHPLESRHLHEDGIRRHRRLQGFTVPVAAWWRGPFLWLLRAEPVQAIALINRMLNHAAEVRTEHLCRIKRRGESVERGRYEIKLDLPGVGIRTCIGDSHVWRWYRGMGVGPNPCKSALLAVERFVDELLAAYEFAVGDVVETLFVECRNLAMPGLVVGLLIRRLSEVGDLLDGWLVRPEVWNLEFERLGQETSALIRATKEPDLVGEERRSYNFRAVTMEMVLRAAQEERNERIEELKSLGKALVRCAHLGVERGEFPESVLAQVEEWATYFDIDNYEANVSEEGQLQIKCKLSEEIEERNESSWDELKRSNKVFELLSTYAPLINRAPSIESLEADLEVARGWAEEPPKIASEYVTKAQAAVAAATVLAHADGRVSFAEEKLAWCAESLFEVTELSVNAEKAIPNELYSLGADRSAAFALPALSRLAFDCVEVDYPVLNDALSQCARSPFDEVRMALVQGAKDFWETACEDNEGRGRGGSCHHQIVWKSLTYMLEDCRLGEWDPEVGRRSNEPLSPPFVDTLQDITTELLLEPRLRPPLVAALDATRADNCVSDRCRELVSAFADTHRRAWAHVAKKGIGHSHERKGFGVARALIEFALAEDLEILTEYVREFTSTPSALAEILNGLSTVFTYDEKLREKLSCIWRSVLATALDAIDDGADLTADRTLNDYALADLVPTPTPRMHEDDMDGVVARARQEWLDAGDIDDLIVRWIEVAKGEPKAVDSLVDFARCQSDKWQATTGVKWVEELIGDNYDAIANRTWELPSWLREMHASDELSNEAKRRWQLVLDELAAHGDSRAANIQKIEE